MKIVEVITAANEHVWIVQECAVEGKEVETGFRTKEDAMVYRQAVIAFRRATEPDDLDRLGDLVKQLRRAATIVYRARDAHVGARHA
jgi:hypothetical protein